MEVTANENHLIDDLAVWRHKIRGIRYASLPTTTSRSNPHLLGDMVIASVVAPGVIYAADKITGRKRWRLQMDGLGGASVTSAYGIVYGMSSHSLHAIDAMTGKLRWKFCPYGTKGEWIYSSPTIANGLLFLGDRAGRFHCLDAKSGEHKWWKKTSRAKNRDVNATAVFHNGLTIISTNAGIAIAFEPATGRQVWKQRLDSPSIHELLIFEGRVLVQTWRSIYLLNPDNGEIANRLNWRGEVVVTFVIADDMLIIVSDSDIRDYGGSKKMRCFKNNKLIYEQTSPGGIMGFKWNRKRKLLYESRIDGFGIIRAKTGERLYEIKSKKEYSLQPGIVDINKNLIYLLSFYGRLYALRHP